VNGWLVIVSQMMNEVASISMGLTLRHCQSDHTVVNIVVLLGQTRGRAHEHS